MVNALNKARKSNKGFTLVELIIVIAIIAVLAIVIAPQFIQYVENSRVGTDNDTLAQLARAGESVFATTEGQQGTEVTLTVTMTTDPATYVVKGGQGTFAEDLKKIIDSDNMGYKFKSKAAKESTQGGGAAGTVTITIDGNTGKSDFEDVKLEA